MSESLQRDTQLSSWALNISPSPTIAVDTKAKALKEQGEDVCGFGAGEPDFDTPEHIKEACIRALREGKTKYIPAPGLPALREAIAEKYITDNAIFNAQSSQVIVSPGGKYSCYLSILATCSPGDEVILPAPFWVSYPEMVKLAGAIPKIIETSIDSNFKLTPEQLKETITPKSRLLIINSPSNPTGVLYTRKELEAIVDIALSHNLLILSDEIYEYLLYDGVKHCSPASLSSEAAISTITVSGFSKTFAMTGWRLGTLMASEKIAKAVSKIQSQTTSCATTFAQYGALEAIRNKKETQKALDEMLLHFDRRRLKLHHGLNAISGIQCMKSEGAFYLFPKIDSYGLSSTDFASKLLEEEKVAIVPGIAFGADNYARFSYATSDEIIEKGLKRLENFCNRF